MGTDEAMIARSLAGNSREMAQEVADAYKALFGDDLAAALKKQLSGNFEKACVRWVGPIEPEVLVAADRVAARAPGRPLVRRRARERRS